MSDKLPNKGAIPVADIRTIGQKREVLNIVLFAINRDAKTFTVTTWGKTKELCAWAATISDEIAESVLSGLVCNGSAHQENPFETITALRKENERLKEEKTFMRLRAELYHARENERFTGISSDALARFALGGNPPLSREFPADWYDLNACTRTVNMMPKHLRTAEVLAFYRKYVAYVDKNCSWYIGKKVSLTDAGKEGGDAE